jgi:3-polyprenyl-4-hydroxybenzoate decarboxylase
VTPSESSAIKRVAYEPMFLAHLNRTLGIKGVKRVTLHERMTALRRITIITVEKGTPKTEVWRALYGATSFKADCGKICIAVDQDIDAENSDALFWAMAFRMDPSSDLQVLRYRSPGHGPEREHETGEDSTLLMDATAKEELPPLALPKREYMERAKALWEELGIAQAASAVAVVRRAGRGLAAAMGRSRETRGDGGIPGEWPGQRAAAAGGYDTRNPFPSQ